MMHLHLPHLHHHDGNKHEEDTKHPELCPKCGRKLMERKGIFRRMTPVSNAFVVYGNCLCHSDEDTIEEEHHTPDG